MERCLGSFDVCQPGRREEVYWVAEALSIAVCSGHGFLRAVASLSAATS